MMCLWIVRIFAGPYLVALGLLIVGTYGLFGQDRDPLSGVFLIPLGFPWVYAFDSFGGWVIAATPLINLAILFALCAWLSPRAGRSSNP
ncbi:hypothetical protein [Roseivivax marinus]|uniref:hypothetical protein n=1 Tax=Roseivivax marinus TaxID=1379903 RepID=UPI00273FE7FD|nr:hypothetical protein [Roseivivax marinus]